MLAAPCSFPNRSSLVKQQIGQNASDRIWGWIGWRVVSSVGVVGLLSCLQALGADYIRCSSLAKQWVWNSGQTRQASTFRGDRIQPSVLKPPAGYTNAR